MLVPSPTQAVAVRTWLLGALNTDDLGVTIEPAPFTERTVFVGERDHPRATLWARIATVALVGRGLCRSHVVENLGEEDQALRERRHEHREWTCSITVCSRLNPTARVFADTAGQHLQRAMGAFEGAAAYPMRAYGVAPLRRGEWQDTSRLLRSTEWETRATCTAVWLCGWAASTPVEWVETVRGTGQVDDLPVLPFDSAEGG